MLDNLRSRVARFISPETRSGLTSEQAKRIFTTNATSRSGINVNETAALSYGPVWEGLDLISGDCSVAPWVTYKRLERGKEKAKKHPVYKLLRRNAGNGQTANLFVARLVAQALLYGNAYARIVRSGSTPVALESLNATDVEPYRTTARTIAYKWRYPDDRTPQEPLPASDMFHVPGLTFTQLGGVSLIRHARNTIGRYIAAEAFGEDFFGNSAIPMGWFTSDTTLSPEAQDRFIEEVQKAYNQANGRRFGMGILEQGMGWEPIGINAADAMLVDMLALGPRDVARFFKLPPHKLGVEGTNTYASVEQENLNYYRSCLVHWFSRMESEANDKLFTEKEKTEDVGGLFSEFLADSILRPDALTRHHIYQIGRSAGYYSANDVREMDNRNPVDGGDVYSNPYTTSGVVEMDMDETGQDSRLAAIDHVVTDALTRAANRLSRSKKTGAAMRTAHTERLYEMLAPAASLCGANVGVWVQTLFNHADRGEVHAAVEHILGGANGTN